MQGNSLIEEYEGVKLFDEEFLETVENPDEQKIANYENQIKEIQNENKALYEKRLLTHERKEKSGKIIKNATTQITKLRNKIFQAHKAKDSRLFDLVSKAKTMANQLETLQGKFFDIASPAEKRQLRDKITTLEWELIEATLAEQNKTDALAKLTEYKSSGEKPWFLWKLNFSEVFKQKGGFDIVIGNPPYMIIQTLAKASPELVDAYKKTYLSATGKFDIYCLFVERALALASDMGAINYIMPSKWTIAAFGKGLRNIISSQRNLIRLISFGSHQVFNASTYTSLIWFSKNAQSNMSYTKLDHNIENSSQLETWLGDIDQNLTLVDILNLTESPWVFASGGVAKVLDRMNQYEPIMKKLDGIYQGIVTGDNDVFWIHNCEVKNGRTVGLSKALNERVGLRLKS